MRYVAWLSMVLAMTTISYGSDWRELKSVEQVVEVYPDRMRGLMSQLDLTQPALAEVKRAHEAGDLVAACQALLDHYATTKKYDWMHGLQSQAQGRWDQVEADELLDDIYRGPGETARVPRLANGHLNWKYRGPRDDRQFCNVINRQFHLATLLNVWKKTRDERYARRIDADLLDWLVAADGKAHPEGFGRGRLEAALRMPVWCEVFHTLQLPPNGTEGTALRPATRLLLLAAIVPHTNYLIETLHSRHNFATMQMRGLGMVGLCFTEFIEADDWYTFAVEQLTDELSAQVYPDGVQKEMSSSYHGLAVRNFARFADLARAAGRETPFGDELEPMYNYTAQSIRPDGSGPLNNDSSSHDTTHLIREGIAAFGRADWQFIASRGREGEEPKSPPSRFFPWAGQLISRDGWDVDAQWSFFDVGPWGRAHQHNDKLHLSIYAFGRSLLIDTGRFAYQGHLAEKFRLPYAKNSLGHNVILIDGMGQLPTEKETDRPLEWFGIAPDFDYAIGTYAGGLDPRSLGNSQAEAPQAANEITATHTRALIYERGQGWIAIDHVRCKGSRRLTPMWHFAVDCNVEIEGNTVRTADPDVGNLHIRPLGQLDWTVNIAKGQESPVLQGWYSPAYGIAEPAPCAVYNANMLDEATFGWVITPGKGDVSPPNVQWSIDDARRVTIRAEWAGRPAVTYVVPIAEPGAAVVRQGE